MTTQDTQNITPEEAAKKLAALIPSPDDAPEEPSALAHSTADTPAPPEERLPVVSAAGPAPPLHAFVVDDDKGGTKKKPTTRARASAAGSNAAKREVEKMLPSAVRVHVYKRNRHGKMSFVSDYSANDLAAQGSIERFLHEYVVPEYEYGEYAVYMQQPGAQELKPLGSVSLEEPLSHRRRREGNGGDTKEILDLFMKQHNEAVAASAQQKDPLQQMQETLKFLEGMRGDKGEKSSMDPMMMMLLMQMQQKQAPAGPDPIMLKIIERLERMEESSFNAAMLPPPPPPPPPPPDPMASLAPLLQMMMSQQKQSTDLLIAAMTNKSNPVEDLARLNAITGATDDRMTTKDMIALIPTLKDLIAPNRDRSSMTEAMETLRSVKLLEREFGGGGNEASSSFWDFLRDFITSDAGARIAEAMMAQDAAKKVDERQQQRRMAAQGVVSEEEASEEEGLVIPEAFRKTEAVALNTAATSPERLQALVRAFQRLGAYPDFRPYMAKIIGLMKENRKMECLDFVGQFLESMVDAGAIELEPAQKSLDDLRTYWIIVRQQLKMPDTPEVFPEGYEPEPDDAEDDAEDEHAATVTPAGPNAQQRLAPDTDADDDDEEEGEIDAPRRSRRNPERDVKPLEPTLEQLRAQEELRKERERELASAG